MAGLSRSTGDVLHASRDFRLIKKKMLCIKSITWHTQLTFDILEVVHWAQLCIKAYCQICMNTLFSRIGQISWILILWTRVAFYWRITPRSKSQGLENNENIRL